MKRYEGTNLPSEVTLHRHTAHPHCECGWTTVALNHQHYHAWRHVFRCHMPITWQHHGRPERDCPEPYNLLLSEAAISYGVVGPKPTKWGLLLIEIQRAKTRALNRFIWWLDEVT